jgi:hypothetical protein
MGKMPKPPIVMQMIVVRHVASLLAVRMAVIELYG